MSQLWLVAGGRSSKCSRFPIESWWSWEPMSTVLTIEGDLSEERCCATSTWLRLVNSFGKTCFSDLGKQSKNSTKRKDFYCEQYEVKNFNLVYSAEARKLVFVFLNECFKIFVVSNALLVKLCCKLPHFGLTCRFVLLHTLILICRRSPICVFYRCETRWYFLNFIWKITNEFLRINIPVLHTLLFYWRGPLLFLSVRECRFCFCHS